MTPEQKARQRDLHRQLVHDFDLEDWPAFTDDLRQIRRIDPKDYVRLCQAYAKQCEKQGYITYVKGEAA